MSTQHWLQQGERYAVFKHRSHHRTVRVIVQGEHLINQRYTHLEARKLWGNLVAQGWRRVEAPMTFDTFLATVDPHFATRLQSSC